MNEESARTILGDMIQEDNSLFCLGHYISWTVGDSEVVLDSSFSLEDVEAIAWWIRNKGQ